MGPTLQRIVSAAKLVVVVVVVITVVRVLRRRRPPEVTGEARWPPLTDDPRAGSATPTPPATSETPRWVEPVEGTCPASHPIKGNADSGIYHLPGGLSYERTVPERCYADPADAEADGFRAAKR